jgi:hypothetical protein
MKDIVHSEHVGVGGNGTYAWVLEKNGMTGCELETSASVRENWWDFMAKVTNIVFHKRGEFLG